MTIVSVAGIMDNKKQLGQALLQVYGTRGITAFIDLFTPLRASFLKYSHTISPFAFCKRFDEVVP